MGNLKLARHASRPWKHHIPDFWRAHRHRRKRIMITGIGTPNSHSKIPRPIGCPYMAMELANHNPAMGGGLHPWMHWLGNTNPMTRSAADETDTIFPRCNGSAPPGFI